MTPQLDTILATFERSLEDGLFSRKEKQEVVALIRDASLERRDLALLRSKIFDIAKVRGTLENLAAIIDWLEVANKALLPQKEKTPKGATKSYFSPGEECLNAVLRFIREAQDSLLVCVFTLSDDRITEALISAHRGGVKVRIITDNDKLEDLGSDIRQLAKEGIPVRVDRTSNHMHHKFAVADEAALLTGSFNWTRSASRYNNENIIVTTERAPVKDFTRHFEKLWPHMVPFQ